MSPATATTAHAIVDSPIGPLTLVAEDGALTALSMDGQRHLPDVDLGASDRRPLAAAIEQLDAYFTGELTRFDLPLAPRGTPFQRQVWQALQDIPYGETTSYGELAARIGQPGASRAVGLANGRNPIAIVIPCHRVIGADGRLTGYGGGIERKRFLLELERGQDGGRLF